MRAYNLEAMPRLFLLCSFLIALSASAQQRRDYMADYGRHPGGTPEEELWQVLVLQQSEGEWNSSVSADMPAPASASWA